MAAIIKVPAGRIFKDGKVFDVAAVEFNTLSYNQTNYITYIEIDNETSPTPVFTIKNTLNGWSGYPDQPSPPLTKYFKLAKVKTDNTNAYFIDRYWQGGDIPWPSAGGGTPPTPTVYEPFDLVLECPGSPPCDLWVVPGTVNGLLPSNILTHYSYTSGTTWVYLVVGTNGSSVTSLSITNSATAPVQGIAATANSAPSSFNIPLGVVIDGVISQIKNGNIAIWPAAVFYQDRVPPVVGLSPIITWWSWVERNP